MRLSSTHAHTCRHGADSTWRAVGRRVSEPWHLGGWKTRGAAARLPGSARMVVHHFVHTMCAICVHGRAESRFGFIFWRGCAGRFGQAGSVFRVQGSKNVEFNRSWRECARFQVRSGEEDAEYVLCFALAALPWRHRRRSRRPACCHPAASDIRSHVDLPASVIKRNRRLMKTERWMQTWLKISFGCSTN